MEAHFDIIPATQEEVKEVSLEGTEAPPPLTEMTDEELGLSDDEHLDELVVEKRPKLTNDEVFSVPVVAPVKKERKKRKPMTEAQLESLSKARAIALESRLKKKAKKDQINTLKQKVAKKKELKLEQEIMDELSDEDIPEQMKTKIVTTRKVKEPSITPEQIAHAVATGVETYDRKRKAEKVVKRSRQAKEKHEAEVVKKIQNAISVNPWDQFLM
tara:strand:+ start:1429 stop:2073 length:645 start_codon:yes stop_codon:yes gene_type:complete